jgi:hypothetical protein
MTTTTQNGPDLAHANVQSSLAGGISAIRKDVLTQKNIIESMYGSARGNRTLVTQFIASATVLSGAVLGVDDNLTAAGIIATGTMLLYGGFKYAQYCWKQRGLTKGFKSLDQNFRKFSDLPNLRNKEKIEKSFDDLQEKVNSVAPKDEDNLDRLEMFNKNGMMVKEVIDDVFFTSPQFKASSSRNTP